MIRSHAALVPRFVAVLALVLLTVGCAGARREGAGTPAPAAPAATLSTTPGDGSGAALPGAVLGPGDVVRLRIAYEPELSGDYQVDETGVVVLPMLGAVRVVQMDAPTLRRALTERYAVYLRNPAIEVTPLRRVAVLGAVRNPGLYTADLTTSIGETIALAGGLTPEGNPDRIELLRDGRRLTTSIAGETRLAGAQVRSGDQLYVRQRSWISRNAGVVASVVSGLVSIAFVLATR